MSTYRSAGLISSAEVRNILQRAVCVPGAPERRVVVSRDGSSVEIVKLPQRRFNLRVSANDEPIPPAPAMAEVA